MKEMINNENENDYFDFNDNVPNHYVGIKPRETMLR